MQELPWFDLLAFDVRFRWDLLCTEARAVVPGSPLPHGVSAEDAVRAVLAVAEAKGLIWLETVENGFNITFTPAGHPLTPHIAALTAGRFDAWATCVTAVRDAAAVPQMPRPTPDPSSAAPPAQMTVEHQAATAAFSLIRELHPKLATGEYRCALGPSARPTHVGWMPADEPQPLPGPGKPLVLARARSGRPVVLIELGALPDLLAFAALDAGLANTIAVGDARAIVPMPGQEPIWQLFETLRAGRLDVPALMNVIERLVAQGPRFAS
jgi:hypothetical protein